jgi:vacuolar-type H+-ATPase subunit D/Vma8
MVSSSVNRFARAVENLGNEFTKSVKEAATSRLGCDSRCVNTCTNTDYFNFWEMADCLSSCSCSEIDKLVLDVKNATYSYPNLALYAGDNLQGW